VSGGRTGKIERSLLRKMEKTIDIYRDKLGDPTLGMGPSPLLLLLAVGGALFG